MMDADRKDINPLLTDKEIGVIPVGEYARQLYFVIPGSPVPAVRMTQRSKFVNPAAQNYLTWKAAVGHLARQAMADTEPFSGAILLSIDVRMNGDRRNRKQRPWDLENVDKAIGDALNGVAYRDDWQVEAIWSEIHIGIVDEVRVKVIELRTP